MMLNMPTDHHRNIKMLEQRQQYVEEQRTSRSGKSTSKSGGSSAATSVYDQIPILLRDLVFASRSDPITASVAQGSLTLVAGSHGLGKTSIIRNIASTVEAQSGQVLIPPHLRIVEVAHHPEIAQTLSLWENLTFG